MAGRIRCVFDVHVKPSKFQQVGNELNTRLARQLLWLLTCCWKCLPACSPEIEAFRRRAGVAVDCEHEM